jgi:hypothetical protein
MNSLVRLASYQPHHKGHSEIGPLLCWDSSYPEQDILAKPGEDSRFVTLAVAAEAAPLQEIF